MLAFDVFVYFVSICLYTCSENKWFDCQNCLYFFIFLENVNNKHSAIFKPSSIQQKKAVQIFIYYIKMRVHGKRKAYVRCSGILHLVIFVRSQFFSTYQDNNLTNLDEKLTSFCLRHKFPPMIQIYNVIDNLFLYSIFYNFPSKKTHTHTHKSIHGFYFTSCSNQLITSKNVALALYLYKFNSIRK